MIKVVSYVPPQSIVKQIVCGKCGATLEYTPNEVKVSHGVDVSGGPDGQEWIVCPVCTNKLVIRSW